MTEFTLAEEIILVCSWILGAICLLLLSIGMLIRIYYMEYRNKKKGR